mgnify:CR=1 FL=1
MSFDSEYQFVYPDPSADGNELIIPAPFTAFVKKENDMNCKFQFVSLTPPNLPPTGGEEFSPLGGIKGGHYSMSLSNRKFYFQLKFIFIQPV